MGGDRVSGGGGGPMDVRLWRDVLPYNPTVVTIMLGMNDGSYRGLRPAGLRHLRERIQAYRGCAEAPASGDSHHCHSASAYDDVTRAPGFEGGYNRVLIRYGEFLSGLASERMLDVADLNTPIVNTLTKANAADPGGAARLIPGQGSSERANRSVMAQGLLKSWKAPAVVTEVEIDAARTPPQPRSNTRVSDIKSEKGVGWTQMDEALPMALNRPGSARGSGSEVFGFRRVAEPAASPCEGTGPRNHRLEIDGELAGSFSAEQLASGINLAELPTPMVRQAANVHALTLQHTAIHNTRWRQFAGPATETASPPNSSMRLKGLDELEAKLVHDQRASAQPRLHRFQVSPE